MKLKTVGCVALMAISTAAIAQTTRSPSGMMNNMATGNTMTTDSPSAPMNTSDEGMMNDSSMPNGSMAPNSSMPPR